MSVDAQILHALRSAGSGSISGAELSQELGISRRTLYYKLEEYQKMGFKVE